MKTNRQKTSLLWLAIVAAVSQQAMAKTEDSLTVWASPQAVNNQIINQQQLQNQQKNNVADVLATIPGVILQKSGMRNELSVRVHGYDSRQIPVFYDGVPIYVPYDGNLDLSRFLITNLASAEVSSGYSSLLQGPNQMGGSINLVSKTPQKPVAGGFGYRQSFTRGRDNGYEANASLALRNDIGYLQISGSQFKQRFTGLPHGINNTLNEPNGQRLNSANDDKSGMFKIGVTPRVSDEYSLTYINQKAQKNDPPYAGILGKPQYWQWPEYNKESYYYQGITHFADIFTLKSRAYHDTFINTLYTWRTLNGAGDTQDPYSNYNDYSNGAGLQLSADLRDSDQLSFALHWKQDVHRQKDTTAAPYETFKDRTWSLASEYQWTALDNLSVITGISYDWRNSITAYRYKQDGTQEFYAPNRQQAFNWQIMGKYSLANQDTISLSYSDRSRFPTLKERYQSRKARIDGEKVLINPFLQPERGHNLQLRYDGNINKQWAYNATVYYNQVHNAITNQYIAPLISQNRNSGEIDYSGLDLAISGKLHKMLSVGASYSLIHAKVKQQEIGHVTQLPAQTASGWLTFTPWQPLNLTFYEEVRSSSYSRNDGKRKAAGFAVSSLRLDYQLAHGISVNASVDNLFDATYAYEEGFFEPGRTYHLGVNYKF